MKQLLLATAIGILGSSLASATITCSSISGNSYTNVQASVTANSGCTVTDAGHTWLITNFSNLGVLSSGYGETTAQVANDLKVSFYGYSGGGIAAGVSAANAWAANTNAGVYVSYTYAASVNNGIGGTGIIPANQFIATSAAGLSQSVSIQSSFSFLNSGDTPFTSAFGIVDGYKSATCFNNGAFLNCPGNNNSTNIGDAASMTKNYDRGQGPFTSLTPTDSATFHSAVQSSSISGGFYAVTDTLQIRTGSIPGPNPDSATASITSFGNGQYIILSSGVPEPMTMGLMGAGLLALGLIRRFRA